VRANITILSNEQTVPGRYEAVPNLPDAYRKCVKYPVVILLPVALAVASYGLQLLLVRTGVVGSPWALLGILVGILSPAAASGYAAVVGVATKDRSPSWSDFAGNLFTFYWRILGAALVVGIAVSILFGRLMMSAMSAGGYSSLAGSWGAILVNAVLGLASHIWFAALVLEGCGAWEAVIRGSHSLSARPREYATLAAAWLGAYLALSLLGRVLPAEFASTVVSAVVSGYFRLAAFVTYEGAYWAGLPWSSDAKPPVGQP
jgi:hypothetical protein